MTRHPPEKRLLSPMLGHEPVFLQGFIHCRQRECPRACLPRRHQGGDEQVCAAEILRKPIRPTQYPALDRQQHHPRQPCCDQCQAQPIPIVKSPGLPSKSVNHLPRDPGEQSSGQEEHSLPQRSATMALHEENRGQSRHRRPDKQCCGYQRARITHHQPVPRSWQPPAPQ